MVIMNQHPAFEQNVTMYMDKASMANGGNGESTLQVVTPQAIEELEMGLVLPMQAHLVAPLFGG